MPDPPTEKSFVLELTQAQNRIFAFLLSQVGNHDVANDLLQQTNLVLFEKRDHFKPGSSFIHWAFAVARFEVLAYFKRARRDRHVFDAELTTLMAEAAEDYDTTTNDRLAALRNCLHKLPARHADLLRRRYFESVPLAELASAESRAESTISSRLHRIRQALLDCIERHLVSGGAA